MPKKQNPKENQVNAISTSAKVGLTTAAVWAMYGCLIMMNTCKDEDEHCGAFQRTTDAVAALIMFVTSPVAGLVAAGVSELSFFACKKIAEQSKNDEPLAKLKTI